ncbi:MAG TPA: fused MFS/spermidine synthase [Bryobacteraceae bacterium]|nr:fused MFS/spermidine synthase [Bryobacteraceae bacterium]
MTAFAITLASLLLFLIQPMLAKAMLPSFGGSAGVWTSSVMFFQLVLLGGYLYSHVLVQRLPWRVQKGVHAGLLCVSLLGLPLHLRPLFSGPPSLAVLGTLTLTVGMPFFLLSSTTPLLQAWISRGQGELPARLFALSNVASLAALLAYPFIIEPRFTLRQQMLTWCVLYGIWVLLMVVKAWRQRADGNVPHAAESADGRSFLLWATLAGTASALWLSIANHISQDIAAVPFFWIVPLSLYLLSFVLTFDSEGWYRPAWFRWLMPVALLGIAIGFALRNAGTSILAEMSIFCMALFICCMFCHGELVRSKPPAAQLTSFYLAIAAGGAVGGLFVGVLAPLIFTEYMELPVSLIGCTVLAMALLFGASPNRLLRLGFTALLAAFAAVYTDARAKGDVHKDRNFYGTLWIRQDARTREMLNGTTKHGAQWLEPSRKLEPLTYYGPQSGIAQAFNTLRDKRVELGVVGLGTGTLAAFGKPGDRIIFYELNPAVFRAASQYFSYLRDSPATIEVIPGDARLSLQNESRRLDALIIDAFSGDAIPTHLLTREAMDLYLQHLKPEGFLAFHVTNRYLDLTRVVSRLAQNAGLEWLIIDNLPDEARGINFATWVIASRNHMLIEELRPRASVPLRGKGTSLWTDDFSNLLEVLR